MLLEREAEIEISANGISAEIARLDFRVRNLANSKLANRGWGSLPV